MENLKQKIDISRLSRNFFIDPLKKFEKGFELLEKSDLEYLYLELKLSGLEIANLFNVPKTRIFYMLALFGLKRDKREILQIASKKSNQIKKERYGEDYGKIIAKKVKKTCEEKYGKDYQKIFGEKAGNTKLAKSHEEKERTSKLQKETCLKKYGVTNPSKVKEIQEKKKETCLEKYGVEFYNQSSESKERHKKCWKEKSKDEILEISKKREETCLEKYGVKHVCQNFEILKKREETYLKRYGVKNASQTENFKKLWQNTEYRDKIQEKIAISKAKNNTFHTSKPEIEILNLLQSKFPDVKSQYFDKERYPFVCDFYIPSLDLFIEFQGTWLHGEHPFDENNLEDLKIVEDLKKKSKELNFQGKPKNFYLQAVYVWTKLDPKKRKIAKENNLNFKEFFSKKEFEDWFKTV